MTHRLNRAIDAHQHYWKLDRGDYGWLTPELAPLYRDFLPDDLGPLLRSYGVRGTIAVQAAPTVAETEYLLELAEHDDTLLGVVGWIDLEAGDARDTYRRLKKRYHRLVGIRPMLHTLSDPEWALRPSIVRVLRELADEGVPLDLVLSPGQLPIVAQLLVQVPNLRVVLDHLGTPEVKRTEAFQSWADGLAAIADHPQAMCKISGMITLAGGCEPELLKPYVAHAVSVFGTDRIMFGSDWPVALLAGGYDEVVRLFLESLPAGIDQEALERMVSHNALKFYRIPDEG